MNQVTTQMDEDQLPQGGPNSVAWGDGLLAFSGLLTAVVISAAVAAAVFSVIGRMRMSRL